MKIQETLPRLLLLVVVCVATTAFVSCNQAKETPSEEPAAVPPPPPPDTSADSGEAEAILPAPAIIIEDTRVMLANTCSCAGDWTPQTTLATANATLALPLSFPAGDRPREIFLCEVQFANTAAKSVFKLGFDKNCNIVRYSRNSCSQSAGVSTSPNLPKPSTFVRVGRNAASVNVKPQFNLSNQASLLLTPTNCNGCKVRIKRCTGNWTWSSCAAAQ